MLNFDFVSFNNALAYFTYVMQRYFRKEPPLPVHIYLSGETTEDASLRRSIAENCRFPAIINSLANDENDAVRASAHENDFWKLVGCYQDILGFGKKERKAFARNEGPPNILVLLMFEDDPEIVEEILNNPTISLKMLVLYMKLLNERGRGRKDIQLYEIARRILSGRREQIIKISAIYKAAEKITHSENIDLLLNYLADPDRTVHQAIENILSLQDATVIKQFVNYGLEDKHFENPLKQFSVLTWLLSFIKKRDNLRQTSINALKLSGRPEKGQRFLSISDFFQNLLSKKRSALVKYAGTNLTDFDNIILLCLCHIDDDKNLRHQAAGILSVEDILNLVNDISTPRRVFRQALNILENHYDEGIVEQVHDTHMRESRRLRDSLKELELTVQAYFDIIFQSLGYNKINEFINVVRAVKTTEKQFLKFRDLIHSELAGSEKQLYGQLEEVKRLMKRKANIIYFDIAPHVTKELNYIFSLIESIFDLNEMGLQSLRPGTPQDIESEIRARARLIWQSAISIYLGRIKDLAEMIRKKIIKAAQKSEDCDLLEKEMEKTALDLEQAYKNKIQCSLTIRCQVCSRRGCAAERFLRETHFFIKEYLDNFTEEEDGPAENEKEQF